MKALLTGASSFSGLWFARALAEEGIEVVAPLRGDVGSYSGVRQMRVKALGNVATVVPHIEFGSSEFFALIDKVDYDLFCHHAAYVSDYRSPDFDINRALAENTREFKKLSERLASQAMAAVILTGSVFEPDEGAGTRPLRAFSPYGLSKSLTASIVRYWCEMAGMPLGKFVIANPFGPFEEPRFCAYLIKTWVSGEVAEVRTPRYVRDNIHVSLLAQSYARFAIEITKSKKSGHYAPSFYVESQGSFADRFAREVGRRVTMPCRIRVGTQVDFSEPMVRINTDPIDLDLLDWNEQAAWDELVTYYRDTFRLC